MKAKIFSPFKRLRDLIQEKPEKSALVVTIILVAPMFVWAISIIQLPQEASFDAICKVVCGFIFQTLAFGCVGLFFWLMFVLTFGEKKQRQLSEAALKSGLQVMINQALIENGSITKPEEMVKL